MLKSDVWLNFYIKRCIDKPNQIESHGYRIKTDLIPVKRKRENFELDETKQRVQDYLEDVMHLTDSKAAFYKKSMRKSTVRNTCLQTKKSSAYWRSILWHYGK